MFLPGLQEGDPHRSLLVGDTIPMKGGVTMERPVLGPIDPVTGRPLYLPHDVVSGTEATGLEPIPPRTPEEAESYAELYDWPLADQPPRR